MSFLNHSYFDVKKDLLQIIRLNLFPLSVAINLILPMLFYFKKYLSCPNSPYNLSLLHLFIKNYINLKFKYISTFLIQSYSILFHIKCKILKIFYYRVHFFYKWVYIFIILTTTKTMQIKILISQKWEYVFFITFYMVFICLCYYLFCFLMLFH